MLAVQRRERILECLALDGAVTVTGLARLLDVSEMTVRRDLDTLDALGQLTKVHGGATAPLVGSGIEPGFMAKSTLAAAQKLAISREALAMIEPGATIGLTAGTTTFQIAQAARALKNITVVTNSIRVAEAFHGVPSDEIVVVVTGGQRTPSDALVGPMSVEALSRLNLDICFMGVHGMDEHAGFTTPNVLEADTNRAFIRSARQCFVVADSSKWGEVGLARIAGIEDVTGVITDAGSDIAKRRLRDGAKRVIIATPERTSHA